MAIHSSEALILDVRNLQERDRIVVFLTRDRGRVSGVAKGARAKHSRFAGMLQPLAKARITWFEKEGRDLVRISDIDLERSADKIQEDLEGILLSAYLAEHMVQFTQENEPGDLPFRLLDSVIAGLLEGVDQDLAARYFESWVLRLAGIFPPPDECPACGRPFEAIQENGEGGAVIPRGGEGLICFDCAGRPIESATGDTAIGPGGLDFLRRIGRQSLRKVAEEPPPPAVLREVERVNTRVRRDFLQGELKSFLVMQRTLA